MLLNWDAAWTLLTDSGGCSFLLAAGAKLHESFPKNRAASTASNVFFGVGIFGFGLCALAILASFFVPIAIAIYCGFAVCS